MWQALPSRLSGRVRLTFTAGLIAGALVSGVLPQLVSPDGVLEPATDSGLQSLQVGFIAAAFWMLALPLLRHARDNMRAGLAARPDGWRVAQFLSGAFMVPWLAMLAVSDPQRPERFWWLFPFQAIFMSAAFTVGAQQSRSRMVRRTSALLLIMSTCVTPATTQRATEWWANGWSGQDADEIQVVDYVASRLQGGRSASISYNVYFAEYTAALSEVDRRYRVGAQMDLLFEHRHGIRNVNRCPEGVAPHDDYRIAEMRSPALGLDHRLALSFDQYRLLAEVGRFRIFERSD